MPRHPLGYYLTIATHGHILRGRELESVDDSTPYLLDAARRSVVLETILEVCDYRGWKPWAVHVRTNQIHAVISNDAPAERVIKDFKAYCGRRLMKKLHEPRSLPRWATGVAAFHMFEKAEMKAEIAYTLESLGEPQAIHRWKPPARTG